MADAGRSQGAPESDAPLAQRIRFAIAKQTQITAGKAATTTVNCPGIDDADKPGKHALKCTVTYAGKSYTGTLTVDAKQYTASYKFTSAQVAIVQGEGRRRGPARRCRTPRR